MNQYILILLLLLISGPMVIPLGAEENAAVVNFSDLQGDVLVEEEPVAEPPLDTLPTQDTLGETPPKKSDVTANYQGEDINIVRGQDTKVRVPLKRGNRKSPSQLQSSKETSNTNSSEKTQVTVHPKNKVGTKAGTKTRIPKKTKNPTGFKVWADAKIGSTNGERPDGNPASFANLGVGVNVGYQNFILKLESQSNFALAHNDISARLFMLGYQLRIKRFWLEGSGGVGQFTLEGDSGWGCASNGYCSSNDVVSAGWVVAASAGVGRTLGLGLDVFYAHIPVGLVEVGSFGTRHHSLGVFGIRLSGRVGFF